MLDRSCSDVLPSQVPWNQSYKLVGSLPFKRGGKYEVKIVKVIVLHPMNSVNQL